MSELPTGTVTFLFTDIEGSTRLLEHVGPALYDEPLSERRRVLRAASPNPARGPRSPVDVIGWFDTNSSVGSYDALIMRSRRYVQAG